jgi:hypothetical protein
MKRIKKALLVAGIIFIAMQFIQPAKNINNQFVATDISKTIPVPGNVQAILKNACYDCHSNNTNYPWYAYIQPSGWLLSTHIAEAKGKLNFNEFGNYSRRRQISKLDGIANSIKDGIMPLSSYKLMHKSARLTQNEKELLIKWVQQSQDILSVKN